jgi:hypothetical protein
MDDYNKTRRVATKITDRFSTMLRDLEDDFEEEIVAASLMKYYNMCNKPDKIDNTVNEYIDPDEDLLWAIERVLQDYLNKADFDAWVLTVKGKHDK